MADRHERPPISFRPRKEIEPWLHEYAHRTGQSPGTVLAEALEAFRQHDGATTSGATTKRARKPAKAEPAREAVPTALPPSPVSRRLCPHPGTRTIGGWCPECGVVVEVGGWLPQTKRSES